MDLIGSDDVSESDFSEQGSHFIPSTQGTSAHTNICIIASEEQSSGYIEDDLPTAETNDVAASASVNPALDNTPLSDDHEPKHLRQALRDFKTQWPP